MGVVRRKYYKERVDLHKKYKRPLLLVAQTMSPGFTDDDFCEAFENLQPCLWRELQDKYESYRDLDVIRKAKGRTLRNFPLPKIFILSETRSMLSSIRNKHKQGSFDISEAVKLRQRLEKKAKLKVDRYRQLLELDLYFIQEVKPPYVEKLISLYYRERKRNTLNVSMRLWIIQEAAKYKSKQTIQFLKRVQSGEKNEKLRMTAYYALLKMHAPDVKLHRLRKGKKRQSQILEPQYMATPQELLQTLYNADFESMKEFDVFISHSSENKELIHSLMRAMNKERKVCYIDWIADREQLKREMTSQETAEVIVNRIKQSNIFIYVLTKECIASKWSPWELGYAYAINKPICVYKLEEIDKIPEYLGLYSTFTDVNSVIDFVKKIK